MEIDKWIEIDSKRKRYTEKDNDRKREIDG